MLNPSDYFMLILVFCIHVRHFKRSCFCELFSNKENSRKLIAGVLSAQSAVVDCLHYDVCGDPTDGLAVPDHKRCITEFTDHTGCPV